MDPTWQFSAGRAGIGAGALPDNPHFRGIFQQLFVSIRTHQRVPPFGMQAPRQRSPNTTENVDAPASGGSIPWTQWAKRFTKPWEMHEMTTVCETTRTRVNLDALLDPLLHKNITCCRLRRAKRSFVRTGMDIANAFPGATDKSLHQRIHLSYPTVLFIDNGSWK